MTKKTTIPKLKSKYIKEIALEYTVEWAESIKVVIQLKDEVLKAKKPVSFEMHTSTHAMTIKHNPNLYAVSFNKDTQILLTYSNGDREDFTLKVINPEETPEEESE